MKKNNLASGYKTVQALCITFLSIFLLSLIDHHIPEITIAPLSGLILIFGLALAFPPKSVFLASLFTLAYVCISLRNVPSFDPTHADSIARFWIRTLTFCAASLLAILTSHLKTQLNEMLGQTLKLLGEIPAPILISNFLERVVWTNSAAERLLGSNAVKGRLFREVIPWEHPELTYKTLFSNPNQTNFGECPFPNHTMKFVKLSTGNRSLLATIFLPTYHKTASGGREESNPASS